MLKTRYEDYSYLDNKLPFTISVGIQRSATVKSHETNWHENLEIQIFTQGRGYVLLDEKKYEVNKDDIIVVNSNVIHYTGSSDNIKYTCIIINSEFCRQADIDPAILTFKSHLHNQYLTNLLKKLEMIYLSDDICRIAIMQEILLKILIELRKKHTIEKNNNMLKNQSFEAVKKTIHFIRQNYSRKLLLDEISKNVFVDKYTLSREFKKVTRQTIIQYINNYRCNKAAEFISGGITIEDAAIKCGFNNMSFFSKTFKRYMGCLPSAYKPFK